MWDGFCAHSVDYYVNNCFFFSVLFWFFFFKYRHVQVTAMSKKDKPHLKHYFDPWHLAKSVRKDLVAVSKKEECANFVHWISFIVNHLW